MITGGGKSRCVAPALARSPRGPRALSLSLSLSLNIYIYIYIYIYIHTHMYEC